MANQGLTQADIFAKVWEKLVIPPARVFVLAGCGMIAGCAKPEPPIPTDNAGRVALQESALKSGGSLQFNIYTSAYGVSAADTRHSAGSASLDAQGVVSFNNQAIGIVSEGICFDMNNKKVGWGDNSGNFYVATPEAIGSIGSIVPTLEHARYDRTIVTGGYSRIDLNLTGQAYLGTDRFGPFFITAKELELANQGAIASLVMQHLKRVQAASNPKP
jgi:hypothetical protein